MGQNKPLGRDLRGWRSIVRELTFQFDSWRETSSATRGSRREVLKEDDRLFKGFC